MTDQLTIDQTGFVDSVDEKGAKVRINCLSACASCHARGVCSAVDQSERIITASTSGQNIMPGERVKVLIAKRAGLRAVAIGYVYPFFLLMTVLITLTAAGTGELEAGLWSLASLVPYYLVVFLLKGRINRAFTFRLEKI